MTDSKESKDAKEQKTVIATSDYKKGMVIMPYGSVKIKSGDIKREHFSRYFQDSKNTDFTYVGEGDAIRIRDPCDPTFLQSLGSCKNRMEAVRWCQTYCMTAYPNTVCEHRLGNKLFIVACKDIKKGEELTLRYGDQYWLDYYAMNATNPIARAACIYMLAKMHLFPAIGVFENIAIVPTPNGKNFEILANPYDVETATFAAAEIKKDGHAKKYAEQWSKVLGADWDTSLKIVMSAP